MAHGLEECIKGIARQISQDEPMSRSELAYQLRAQGISQDSLQVSRLVYETYLEATEQERKALQHFRTNDMQHTLIEEYRRLIQAEQGQIEQLQQRSQNHLEQAAKKLQLFGNILGEVALSGNAASVKTQLARLVTGTSGTSKVQDEAKQLISYYEKAVGQYQSARLAVENTVKDFVAIRSILQAQYLEYVDKLIDIFGEQLRAQAPELFDFAQIEYLDAVKMFESISLEFDKLDSKCTELMGEVIGGFRATLDKSSNTIKQVQDKRVALVLIATGFVEHYLGAAEKTARLKREFSILQTSATKDLTHLAGDLKRLELLHQTLERLFIPKVEVYQRFSKHILSDELRQLLDKIYRDERIAELDKKRQELRSRARGYERELSDCRENIHYYSEKIKGDEALLQSLNDEYLGAKQRLPQKPSFLANIFTLGSAGKRYNQEAYAWQRECAPLVRQYEQYQADIKIDKEELSSLEQAQKLYERDFSESKREAERCSAELRKAISVDPKLKETLYPHFNDLVALLRGAKELLGLRLDEQHLKAIPQSAYPDKAERELSDKELALLWAQRYTSEHKMTEDDAQRLANKASQAVGLSTKVAYSAEDLQAVALASDQAIERGLAMYEEMLALETQMAEDKLKQDFYHAELARLQESYKALAHGVEQQESLLRAIVERVKFSASDEERKVALCLLAGIDKNALSQEEWSDFLAGKHQITI